MQLQKNIILDHQQIQHKIKRIAYQIYESNVDENEIILAGIDSNGFLLAKKLKSALDKISDLKTTICKVTIDKKNPLNAIKTSLTEKEYTNKSIVLIDDVLNSGSTLIYGVKHFLNVPLKQFKTAVLVNTYDAAGRMVGQINIKEAGRYQILSGKTGLFNVVVLNKDGVLDNYRLIMQ